MWKTLYFCFLVQYIEISALNISSNSSFHKKHLETLEFSGFYTPNLKYNLEVYSASWLQKTTRYLTTLPQIQEINALESATTGPVLKYSYSNTKFALMTRDYFDYFVEHLSSTTNQIGEESHLVEYITSMLTEKLIFLKKSLKFYEPLRSLMSSTVVIIPYSCKSASQGNDMYRIKKLRLLFFQVTFWSIYRYFRHIMVFVSTSEDYSTLSSLALPLDTLIQTQIDYQTTWELPRYSLLYAAESLQKNESWKQFKYIYYTEADQILTIRNQRAISQWLAQSDDEFVFIPHRMIVS